eukprot:NODE_2828_length_1083_cov_22.027197_g2697_i0.p1 GENE.NODE_2828_length_1083_cov_22.027197_g2697_i0~~NODE_2828_length_1083_cov_22.027197_g2697_i0.p1  ORF type:complete len:159 (-),score=27.63 NODE_2828_length_1083_cov_22.027197_g2697_i0:391-867(-)
MANGAFLALALNFVCSLHRLQLSNYLLFADEDAHREFQKRNISSVEISANAEGGMFSGRKFASLTRKKVMAVARVLERGFDVVFFDTDIVLLRDVITPLQAAGPKDDVLHEDGRTIGKLEGVQTQRQATAGTTPSTITSTTATLPSTICAATPALWSC